LENNVLFIGAHADDVEIGAGGTVAKLASKGYNIWLCILTEENNKKKAAIRKSESKSAAQVLGIGDDKIMYAAFKDGLLSADRDSIALLRQLVDRYGCKPDIIITHSHADSHNDHRAAAELSLSAFRESVILHYSIVNSAIVSDYHPRLFIDTTSCKEQKKIALLKHKSQVSARRILWDDLSIVETAFGKWIGAQCAEAFEVTVQRGASSFHKVVRELNDCAFHAFWHSLLEDRKLMNIHGLPVYRKRKEYDWPSDKDRDGMACLRKAFTDRWFGSPPVEEYNCATERVEALLYKHDIFLSGGAVSNTISRNYFNHFRGVRYIIDYDMPDYKNIRIFDRQELCDINAEYEKDGFEGMRPRIDRSIITIMRNPLCLGRHLIGCMGIHGFGSFAGYMLLSNPVQLRIFLDKCTMPIPEGIGGYQIIVNFDVKLCLPCWDWSTFHKMPIC
jgi:LmbE family N-acetylglucosaminyl deacetylase